MEQKMFYLWVNELGKGWQLIAQSEDEEFIKGEKTKKVKEAVAKRMHLGVSYKITDYDLPEAEKYSKA